MRTVVFESDPTGLLSNVYTVRDVCTLTGPSDRLGA